MSFAWTLTALSACGGSSNNSAPSKATDGGAESSTTSPASESSRSAACTKSPEKLAAVPLFGPMTQGASDIFVVSGGNEIWRVAKADAKTQRLTTSNALDGHQIQGLATDGRYVYYAAVSTMGSPNGQVGRVSVKGGDESVLAADRPLNFYGNLAAGEGSLFWTERDHSPTPTGRIAKHSDQGGDVDFLQATSSDPVPEGLALGGGYVWWLTSGPNDTASTGRKLVRAKPDGTPSVIAEQNGLNNAIATNSTAVFYDHAGGVAVHPFDSGEPTKILNVINPTALAADDSTLYAIDGGSSIRAFPIDGSEPETIYSTTQPILYAFAIDDKCIYWNTDDGVFMRQK